MTPDEKHDAMKSKFAGPAKPLMTQVVQVQPRQPETSTEETESFSVKLPVDLARLVRQNRVDNKMFQNETFVRAVREYFTNHPKTT